MHKRSSRYGSSRNRSSRRNLYSNRKVIDPVDYLESTSSGSHYSEFSDDALSKIKYESLFAKDRSRINEGLEWNMQEYLLEKRRRQPRKSQAVRNEIETKETMMKEGRLPRLSRKEFIEYNNDYAMRQKIFEKGFDMEHLKQQVIAKRNIYQRTVHTNGNDNDDDDDNGDTNHSHP